MRNPFKRDPLAKRLQAVQTELAAFKTKRELAQAEAELQALKQREAYATADPSVKARMDVDREIVRERQRGYRRPGATAAQRREARRALIRLPNEAVSLLTAAKQSAGITTTERQVTIHAQESILDAVNGTPFGFDQIGEYRSLMQVPTLMRELWPYKPTILRTLPMLDFARWICRVVYEECLTAKGLVKGKTNYICRGMRVKVVYRDADEESKSRQQKLEGGEEGEAPEAQPAGGKATEPQPENAQQDTQEQDATMKAAQRFLDRFIDERGYLDKRRERRQRMMIEGEAFMWIDRPDKGLAEEPPICCFVEPDFIRPSQRNSVNQEDPHLSGFGGEDWSFGVLTPKHRYWQPLAYQIVWNDNEEQKVSAEDMFHTAIRERSNIKRCLPPMFAMVDDLIRMTLLRAALADASKFRAGIGGVVKYEAAGQQAVTDWESTIRDGNLGDGASEPDFLPVEVDNSTNLISLPAGRDFVQGPNYPDVGSLQAVYDWHIRAIAQAEQVPEWLVSGAGGEGSFASSLTAESVSIIEFDAEQEKDCAVDKRVLKRVLQAYIDENMLDKNFFDKYDLKVEGESMVSRDAKSEAETAVLHVQNEFCSLDTAATNLGFDPVRERALIEAEKSLGVGPVAQKQAEFEASQDPETMGGKRQQLEGKRDE